MKGVLIEYIPGFKLWDLHDNLRMEEGKSCLWQPIVDQAVRVSPRMLTDKNIINYDVMTTNIIVTKDEGRSSSSKYRTVMIDLAGCFLREPGVTDYQWGRAKYSVNEEGRIGKFMQDTLREMANFELKYTNSDQWKDFAEQEMELAHHVATHPCDVRIFRALASLQW